ncbi:MAG TPA: transglycosylase [Micavibrio sp.]|jgi:soluble lytic murein transglycosylase-like protein|nr:lytic transglycosylase domain-containing protein [Pseudomonadota bacterium]MEC8666037.1 lytic transglycosylase domain-containing protein [Pseudomonadota bacterium]HIF26530.1 transglycosylase [Micavibrio sp.]HIL28479.1 transglycosylase [Micavibrio sp.]
MGKILAACFFLASQTYSIPPAVLLGIYQVEGGQVGQEVGPNDNGSFDLGPMQINTIWMPELSRQWGVSEATARKWVRDDPCTNVGVSAWILRGHIDETQDLAQAIAHYHSRTPKFGDVYKYKVISSMDRSGLLRTTR